MRQIIHTCLLALRLISSATIGSKALDLQYINSFDRALLNAAFGYVHVDPGTLKKESEAAIPAIPVSLGSDK